MQKQQHTQQGFPKTAPAAKQEETWTKKQP